MNAPKMAIEQKMLGNGLRVVLFADGAVEMLPDEEFNAKPKAQGK